jgi:hypothetical protein
VISLIEFIVGWSVRVIVVAVLVAAILAMTLCVYPYHC